MTASGGAAMSPEDFEAALEFVKKNGGKEIKLLGGEPTTHPRFVEFLDGAVESGLFVIVISGGLIPRRALDRLQRLSAEQVRVLLNVAVPGDSPLHEIQRQRQVMALLTDRIVLGINIHSPDVELHFLLELIEQFGLQRQVRMGLSHPILDGDNVHLHPRYFDEVGRRVAEFGFAAQEVGVQLVFDCGWVPCMFPEGALQRLEIGPEQVGLRCNPILDVLPDGKVISCYPMADFHQERLSDWEHVPALAERFSERLSSLRPIGIFKRCADCAIRERGHCVGGCHALAMRRLHDADIEFAVSTVPEGAESSSVSKYELPVINLPLPSACHTPAAGSGHQSACGCGSSKSPKELLQITSCGSDSAAEAAPPIPSISTSPVRAVAHNKLEAPESRETNDRQTSIWSLPYIDQPMSFWEDVNSDLGAWIQNIYLPLPDSPIGTGRPPQPTANVEDFWRHSRLPKSVLLNVATLPRPVAELAPPIIDALQRVHDDFGVNQAVVANFQLAQYIHQALPDFSLTASVLMEVTHPYQARLLNDVCTTLVPGSSIMRDVAALTSLKAAFKGRIRLLVNEACLPLCPYRAQHFREMAEGVSEPKSLCLDLLAEQPWLRLTGAWVLPQHLHLLESLFDELKLAGRVTLRDPKTWRRVVHSYIFRRKLLPNEIGGGPSSVLAPIDMPEELYRYTLQCGHRCHECTRCADYYREAMGSLASREVSLLHINAL
jgi:MoaA/NifB/PqqE/SkfB family radical SAM enzyme